MVSGKDLCFAVDLQHCGSELKTLPFLVDYWQMSSSFRDLCSVLLPHHCLDFRKEYANMKLFSIPSATGRKQTTPAKELHQSRFLYQQGIVFAQLAPQFRKNKTKCLSDQHGPHTKKASGYNLTRQSAKSALIYIGTISLLQSYCAQKNSRCRFLLIYKYNPVLCLFLPHSFLYIYFL